MLTEILYCEPLHIRGGWCWAAGCKDAVVNKWWWHLEKIREEDEDHRELQKHQGRLAHTGGSLPLRTSNRINSQGVLPLLCMQLRRRNSVSSEQFGDGTKPEVLLVLWQTPCSFQCLWSNLGNRQLVQSYKDKAASGYRTVWNSALELAAPLWLPCSGQSLTKASFGT